MTQTSARQTVSQVHSDWALLVGQAYRLGDDRFRAEAMDCALESMNRYRQWLTELVEVLDKEGYQFIFPDKVLVSPDPEAEDWILEFRTKGVWFPVAIEAWLRAVGGVNLTGSHPNWPREAYAYDGAAEEPVYTDPLVVEAPRDYVAYLYDEWRHAQVLANDKTPFRLEVGPDYLHKANVSGGLPYQVSTEYPQVDAILLQERHATTFVGYLRLAGRWGGFPGLDYLQCNDFYLPGARPPVV